MKHFLTTVGLLIMVLGVLTGKIYFDIMQRPQYYLNQIGTAINTHNLVDFEQWVDLNSVAQGIVSDYFDRLAKRSDSSTVDALKAELTPALVAQIREYVKNGRFTNNASSSISKPARIILAQLILPDEAVKQFQSMAFVKEAGRTATAGVKSAAANGGSTIVAELKLQRIKTGWRVVRIANYTDIKTRLQRHEKQKKIKIEDLLIQGIKNTVVWGKFDREEAVLDLSDSSLPGWPSSLVINLDEQERLWFTLVGSTANIQLQIDPGQAEAFEEDGRLNTHYYVQAGEYDFDGDSRAELVIAIGDNNIDLLVNIFKYNPSPPDNPVVELKPENWVLVKMLMGQNKAYLNGRNIRLPYSVGNFEAEYKWVKNGFQEIR
jgi:hypothetical protein